MTPGILPSALRFRLRRFKIVPGDFVSLHASVAAREDQRQKLERLCRYISRPAIAEQRLARTSKTVPSAFYAGSATLSFKPGVRFGSTRDTR
jgi:hypothetical protein